jgi:hypothetical protein
MIIVIANESNKSFQTRYRLDIASMPLENEKSADFIKTFHQNLKSLMVNLYVIDAKHF